MDQLWGAMNIARVRAITLVVSGMVAMTMARADYVDYNVPTPFDLDGNGTTETTTTSMDVITPPDTINPLAAYNVTNSVSVDQTKNPLFKGLTFTWIGEGFTSFLPTLAGGWTDSANYTSYTPVLLGNRNITFDLNPGGAPPKIITKPAQQLIPVNPYQWIKATKDLFSSIQGGANIQDGGSLQLDGATAVAVSTTITDTSDGQLQYTTVASNATNLPVTFSYTVTDGSGNTINSISLDLPAFSGPVPLYSVISDKDVYEAAGQVTGSIDGNAFSFYAPSLVPVPEPGTLSLVALGMLAIGWRRRSSIASFTRGR